MSFTVAASGLRRAEIAFTVIGVTLLGGVLAAVLSTRVYQARQGRAFFASEKIAAEARAFRSPRAAVPGVNDVAPAADPLVLGFIEIPRIGVSSVVREGDDDATLALAVGHIPGTAVPGETGNVALAGHRDSFFRALEHVRIGDLISFRTPGGRHEYVVDSTEIVAPEETSVLDPTPGPVLTLVTCYPFVWVGHAPKRFIVRASRLPREASGRS